MKPLFYFLVLIPNLLCHPLPRNLLTIQKDIKSSRTCKSDCIDKNYNFCPTNGDFTRGNCCTDDSCEGKVDICSNEANSMIQMQYQVCPKESYCGDYYIYPDIQGNLLTIRPTKLSEKLFY